MAMVLSSLSFPPSAVLLSSIPVFMIVIRYNLLRGDFCSERWAIFFSSILPWIFVIPFQTRVCRSHSLCPFHPVPCTCSMLTYSMTPGLDCHHLELVFPT